MQPLRTYYLTLASLLVISMSACRSIPHNYTDDLFVLPPASSGSIAEQIHKSEGFIQHESYIHLLPENLEALHWRIALIDSAEVSLDLQYFIWEDDFTGNLLLHHVLSAADRGVRVRILLDDIMLPHSHRNLAILDRHPDIHIRVFNPIVNRRTNTGLAIRFVSNLRRLNRRMHNKLFLADGLMGIVGGRNLGDSYFGFHSEYNFRDLDAVIYGSVLEKMSQSFDAYWNSIYAIDAGSLYNWFIEPSLTARRDSILIQSQNHSSYASARLPVPAESFIKSGMENFIPVSARYIYDKPDNRSNRDVKASLLALAESAESKITIITPYFLPTETSSSMFDEPLSRGVQIDLLVPSLASINHTIVHSHYRHFREDALNKGFNIFEYKHRPGDQALHYSNSLQQVHSYVSMHKKALIIDSSAVYIGSLNMNHRSFQSDTENGLIICSPEINTMLQELSDMMQSPEESWHVTRNGRSVHWNSVQASLTRPPARSSIQFMAYLWGMFIPIRAFL